MREALVSDELWEILEPLLPRNHHGPSEKHHEFRTERRWKTSSIVQAARVRGRDGNAYFACPFV